MRKKIFVFMLVTMSIIIINQISNAPKVLAASPIRASNVTYDHWHDNLGTMRMEFVIENVSERSIFLMMDDFVLRKSGYNTVKPSHFGGGFSEPVSNPLYTNSSYDLYPGDRIAVSMDYKTGDSDPEGWSLYFRHSGQLFLLAR